MKSAAARNAGTPVQRQEDPRDNRPATRADESNRLSFSSRHEAPTGRVEALLRTHASLVHEIE
jgi:hypothetical protein